VCLAKLHSGGLDFIGPGTVQDIPAHLSFFGHYLSARLPYFALTLSHFTDLLPDYRPHFSRFRIVRRLGGCYPDTCGKKNSCYKSVDIFPYIHCGLLSYVFYRVKHPGKEKVPNK